MLDLMRKNASSWIIKFLLGAIIVVFVLSYGVMREKGRVTAVAKVDDEAISLDEYRSERNIIVERLRRQFGDNFNDDMLKLFNVKDQALNSLINRRLLTAEARRLKLKIVDEELALSINNIAAFKTSGVFDPVRYQQILKSNRLTPEIFEAQQREALLIAKLRDFLIGSVKVSDQEAREWYQWQNTKVNIEFALFKPESYSVEKPTAEVLQSYFDNNAERYKTDVKIKVNYLKYTPDDYKDGIDIEPQEIDDYYSDHLGEFKSEKTVEARHILIKLEQDSDAQTVQAAKTRAEKILERIKEGADFAEMAKTFSEGPTKENGGYLGVFKQKAMVKPFSDVAFSLNPGDVSDLVRTRFGWHIIKVEKVNPESVRTRQEVQEEIRTHLIQENAKTLAYEASEAVYDATFDGDSLQQIAETGGLKLETTDFFSRNGPQGVAERTRFAAAAFELPPGVISEVKEFGGGYFLLQLLEKQNSKIPALEDVKVRVEKDWEKDQLELRAKEAANALLSVMKEKGTDDEVNAGLTTTGFFDRTGSIPQIGSEKEIREAAFSLSVKNNLKDQVFKGQKGFYVFRLKERRPPSGEAFLKQKKSIIDRLYQQKEIGVVEELLSYLRRTRTIVIEKGVI